MHLTKLSIVNNDVAEHGLLLETEAKGSQFIIPIRQGYIYFSQLLSEDTGVIVADNGNYLGPSFIAMVDIPSGKINKKSKLFKISWKSKFLINRNKNLIIASISGRFYAWSLKDLSIVVEGDLLIHKRDYFEFDKTERYFTIERQPNSSRVFHRAMTEVEFDAAIKAKSIRFLNRLKDLVGEIENGDVVFAIDADHRIPDSSMPLGFRLERAPDGFLIISPDTWRVRHVQEHGAIVSPIDERAHIATYSECFRDFVVKTATLTIIVSGKGADHYTKALRDIKKHLDNGIDDLRFGNLFQICFEIEGISYDEKEFAELIPYQSGALLEVQEALKDVIDAYNKAIAKRSLSNQLYWKNEEDGDPALSYLVNAYLNRAPLDLCVVETYIAQLDHEHCQDFFLNVGGPYFLRGEIGIRTQIFSLLHSGTAAPMWNKTHLLDNAARNFSASRFIEILDDELEKYSEFHRRHRRQKDEDIQQLRSSILKSIIGSLHVEFNNELRTIIIEKLQSA